MRGIINRIASSFGFVKRTSGVPFDWVPILGGTGDNVTEPMRESTWVMRAIKLISGPISSVPLRFESGDTPIEDAALDEYWSRPCASMDLSDVCEAFVGWMKLKGEFFVVVDESWDVPFPEARLSWPPIAIARPDRMREVVSGNKIIGWQFTDANGGTHPLLPEKVFHTKFWNPYSEYRGLPEYDAARIAVETDWKNQKFALALAGANGDTGPIISAKGAGLNAEQIRQVTAQLLAKRRATQRGEFVPAFLNGEVTIDNASIRAPDATFQMQRIADREQIFVAFGVPPSMTTQQASFSIGSASDRWRLVEGSCMPMGSKLSGLISRIVSRMLKKPVVAYFDWDEYSTVQQVRNERITAATSLWDRGMPWDRVSEYLSLGLPEFEGSDVGRVSFGLQPVGEDYSPETDPNLAEPVDDEDAPTPAPLVAADDGADVLGEAKSAIRMRGAAGFIAPAAPADLPQDEPEDEADLVDVDDCCSCAEGEPAQPAGLTASQRAMETRANEQWKRHTVGRRMVIKNFRSKFSKVMFAARNEMLSNLRKSGYEPAPTESKALQTRALVLSTNVVFNLSAFTKKLIAAFSPVQRQGLDEAGKQVYEELAKKDAWKTPMPEAVAYVAERENKMKNISEEVFDQVRGEIDAGIKGGDTFDELAKRISSVSNQINLNRGRLVAQTETSVVFGVGRQKAMIEAGVQWKRWLSSRNSVVRPTHQQAQIDYLTPIPINEPFIVGGFALMHPGDPTGPAKEVCNCHCVQIAVADPNEEGEN